jgi:hypothetical protein
MNSPAPESLRPEPAEYHPYYGGYIGLVEDGSILARLAAQSEGLRDLMSAIGPAGGAYRYAPGKWTVRQVLGHVADTERIFGMRATCIARGEKASLPGYEQDDYVDEGGFDARPVDSLVREFDLLRAANLEMFSGLPGEHWRRVGTANGAAISVRALAWILVGHLEHHVAVLQERYAAAFTA